MVNNYYDFGSKGYLSTLAVWPSIFIKAIQCNDWSNNGGRYVEEQLRFGEYSPNLLFPLDFVVKDGYKIRDILEMRSLTFLISDRLKLIFEAANLTGWKTYDVVIHQKDGSILPGFNGFSVMGRNPSEKSDGYPEIPDFFRLRHDQSWLICTQRVVDVLKENKIKDFETTLLSNESYPDVYQQINFPK